MDQRTFGLTVAALRRRHGLTQEALAEQLQVTGKAISKWETGKGYPDISLLPKLAKALGVTVDYLLNPVRTTICSSIHTCQKL